ncbi:MAG: protein kinase, partial [Actinomycetia bacterium]|nr:protein kinase [Actinomycetes bacterium]
MTIDLGIRGYIDAVEIGRGGFGVVYRALQTSLDRNVAIKIMHSAGADPDTERHIRRERETLAELTSHPGIVTVFDAGTLPSGSPWIAMEYCPGGTFADRIRSAGPLPWNDAVDVVSIITEAVGHAHEAGIIHRDIKPANILFTAHGRPKLGDFSTAVIESSSTASATAIAGSLHYTAPELLQGSTPTPQSDIYSLAATLQTAIEGKAPHHHTTSNSNTADIPTPLLELIERCLDKNPTNRPANTSALATQIKRAMTPPEAKPPPDEPEPPTVIHPDQAATRGATAGPEAATAATVARQHDPEPRPSPRHRKPKPDHAQAPQPKHTPSPNPTGAAPAKRPTRPSRLVLGLILLGLISLTVVIIAVLNPTDNETTTPATAAIPSVDLAAAG